MTRVFATLLSFRVSLPLRVIGSLLCNFFTKIIATLFSLVHANLVSNLDIANVLR